MAGKNNNLLNAKRGHNEIVGPTLHPSCYLPGKGEHLRETRRTTGKPRGRQLGRFYDIWLFSVSFTFQCPKNLHHPTKHAPHAVAVTNVTMETPETSYSCQIKSTCNQTLLKCPAYLFFSAAVFISSGSPTLFQK